MTPDFHRHRRLISLVGWTGFFAAAALLALPERDTTRLVIIAGREIGVGHLLWTDLIAFPLLALSAYAIRSSLKRRR